MINLFIIILTLYKKSNSTGPAIKTYMYFLSNHLFWTNLVLNDENKGWKWKLFWLYIHLKIFWHSWFSCYICPRPWCVYCKWYLFKLSSNLLHQPLTEFGVTWLVLVQPPPFSSHSQPCFVQFLKPQRFNANLWIQFLRNTNYFCAWNTNKTCWK